MSTVPTSLSGMPGATTPGPLGYPAAHGASRNYAACPQLGTVAGLPLYLDADPLLHDNLLLDCLCYPPGKPLRRLRLVQHNNAPLQPLLLPRHYQWRSQRPGLKPPTAGFSIKPHRSPHFHF
jgi:hypothetical protein